MWYSPRLADVGAPQPVHLPLLHGAEPGPARQVGQLVQGGPGGDAEVVHEAGGDGLRVQADALLVFLQQVAAEAAQGCAHSSSLLPVNFSYISTMNRLALTVRGPSGRVPTRKAGSSSTKR